MITATHTIAPVSGYAFELPAGSGAWRQSHNDDWEIVVFTPKGRETLVGTRRIDGSACHVWLLPDGSHVAQMVTMTRR